MLAKKKNLYQKKNLDYWVRPYVPVLYSSIIPGSIFGVFCLFFPPISILHNQYQYQYPC